MCPFEIKIWFKYLKIFFAVRHYRHLINVHPFRQRLEAIWRKLWVLLCGFLQLWFSMDAVWGYLVTSFLMPEPSECWRSSPFFSLFPEDLTIPESSKVVTGGVPFVLLKSCSWGYFPLFQLPPSLFKVIFILRGKKRGGLFYDDLVDFSLEEICKKLFKTFAVAANSLGGV